MKKYLSLILLFFVCNKAIPCTTFIIKTNNDLVFGRNLDWHSENGLVVVNQRNVAKKSIVFAPETPIEWTSKFGSVTFNQFGKEFPFGGMNEKGLVIEIMLTTAQYEKADKRKAINELQWIQYQLDNFSTVDEVVNSLAYLRISKVSKELHYLICDASGKSAVLEFINQKAKVYQDEQMPYKVLENELYAASLQKYKQNKNARFCTAVQMVNTYQHKPAQNAVDFAFKTLEKVALSAEWSVVYDIKNKKIHFKTASNKSVKIIDCASFDFNCQKESLCFDLLTDKKELINQAFFPLTDPLNKEKMKDAFFKSQIALPEEVLALFYGYHKNCQCK